MTLEIVNKGEVVFKTVVGPFKVVRVSTGDTVGSVL